MSFLTRTAAQLVRSSSRIATLRTTSSFTSSSSFLTSSSSFAASSSARSFSFHASAPATIKTTTNIAGLDVVPNGREVLIGLLREIDASIASYNKSLGFKPAYNDFVGRLNTHRLKIAEEEQDVEQIEKRIWSGQIEQLIEQAENELDLLVIMNEEVKPWEKPSAETQAEFDRLASANFGEDEQTFLSRVPKPLNKEEQAQADEFWKSIDEEIKADQAREAAERAAKKK